MESINKIIEEGRKGRNVKIEEIIPLFEKFDQIILRGAGAFGSELGKNLLKFEQILKKLVYWDQRAEELGTVNGIDVKIPYSQNYENENVLMINCIPNGSTAGNLIDREIIQNGYVNLVSGMGVYEAVFCPLNSKIGFNSKVCLESKACNWCNCDLLMNLLKKDENCNPNNLEDKLSFQIITFVITHKCTLECKHCGQYIPYFPKEYKIDIPLERIYKDIDLFFDAVDTVGFVSVIGGEPFLHSHLTEIIGKILEKKNFGMLGITTNGICKITDDHLRILKNNRIRVIFSDYTQTLDDKKKQLFNENINKVANAGINYTVGVPLWVLPTDLKKKELSNAELEGLKEHCIAFQTCQTVQDGKYFPCSSTTYIHEHNVANYNEDFIVFDSAKSNSELREQIISIHNKTYYQSCAHCVNTGGLLEFSGEQGTDERYEHLT